MHDSKVIRLGICKELRQLFAKLSGRIDGWKGPSLRLPHQLVSKHLLELVLFSRARDVVIALPLKQQG